MNNSYYRVLGIDYGDVRIGIALSDPTRFLSTGIENYTRINEEKDLNHIVNLINSNNVKVVVFGNPKNMDNSEGIRVEKTKSFADKLSKLTDAKIDFFDERLTSMQAEKMLINASVRRDKRKTVLDKISASIILQDYLDLKKGE